MTATSDLIQKLYIGYFGRAGDPSGMNYWTERSTAGMTDSAIAQSFSLQDEAKAMYGYLAAPALGMGQDAFLEAVYQNLFERSIDSAGLEYWKYQLNHGYQVGKVILAIINGAQGSDVTTVANKLSVANYYTEKVISSNATWTLADDQADAISVIANVTSTASTVTTGKALADTLVAADTAAPSQSFTLTAGTNSGAAFTGGAGNDTFNASFDDNGNQTLNSLDSLTGGAGTDTLNVYIDTTVTPGSLSGIEVINATFEAAKTLNLINAADVTSVNSVASTDIAAFTNIASTSASLGLQDTDQAVSFSFKASAVSGSSDSVTLNVSAATGAAAVTIGSVETITINSAGSANSIDLEAAAATKLVVMGDQSLTLDTLATGGNTVNVSNIDASASSGGVTVTTGAQAGVASTTTISVTGGSGNDTLNVTSLTQAYSVNGGSGNDTITDTSLVSTNTLVGGDGTDKLVVAEADVDNLASGAFTKISGFETLVLSDAATAADTYTLAYVSADLNAIQFDASPAGAVNVTGPATSLTVDLGNGTSSTIALAGTLTVTDTGTGTSDTVTIRNRDLATDAFADKSITSAGYETVVINTTGAGNATAQTIDTVSITGDTGGTTKETLTFTGTNAVALKVGTVDIINAGDLTGKNGDGWTLQMVTSSTATTITGSAGNDLLLSNTSTASSITGGAGNDNITGGSGNDSIYGGDGKDTIDAGAGSDYVDGGAGNDTFSFGANLTSGDTIIGGGGTDTLKVTSFTAGSAANVSGVETLAVSGANTVSLTAAVSFETIDLTDADGQVLNLSSGYTGATTVKLTGDSSNTDKVVNAANIALTIVANAADIDSTTTLTGGTGTDTLKLTADGGTADLTAVTVFDAITVVDSETAGDDITISLGSYATAMTIDGSALNGSDEVLTVSGGSATKNLTVTGGAGNDVITGGSGNDSVVGNAGNDTITAGSGNDNLSGGAGNDTFTLSTNLTYQDTIAGGDGSADVLSVSTASAAIADSDLMNVTGVETLLLSAYTNAVVLGAYATTAGLATVDLGDSNFSASIDARGMTSAVTFKNFGSGDVTLKGGSGNDIFTLDAADTAIGTSDTLQGGAGTDTLRINNNTITTDATGNAVTISALEFLDGDSIEQITINDMADGDANGDISITVNSTYTMATNLAVDGSALDAGETLTFDGSAVTSSSYGAFTVTGGAGNDTITGSSNADSIVGGDGADSIIGGPGADTITGGAGADTFAYTPASSHSLTTKLDNITDFATGTDRLRISLATTASSAQTWDVTDKGDATSYSEGNVLLAGSYGSYYFNTGSETLAMDTDANSIINANDFVLKLTGNTTVNSSDIDIVFDGSGATGALTVTTGAGNDAITGSSAADSITGGAGNDYVNSYTGDDIDTMVGGTGSDTYAVTDEGEADVIVEAASGGTGDVIFFTNDLSIEGVAYGTTVAGAAGDASLAQIEGIVITTGKTATVDSDQITGLSINISETGAGGSTSTFLVMGDDGVADTINLSSLTFTASSYTDSSGLEATTSAMTSGTDYVAVDGGTSNDTITLASIATKVKYNGSGGTDTITGFTSGTDKFTIAAALVSNGTDTDTLVTATSTTFLATATTIGANTGFVFITDSAGAAGAVDTAAKVVTFLDGAGGTGNQTNMASGDKVIIAVRDASDTYIWQWTDSATNTATIDSVELSLLAKLVGVTSLADGDFAQF